MSKLIYKKLSLIMKDLGAVGKTRKNTAQNYSFRGIDDIYNALNPLMALHEVVSVPVVISNKYEEKVTKNGTVMNHVILEVEFHFYAEDGSSVTCRTIGEALDSGDKAANKAMASAHKYALLQVFCIPTEEPKDTENESHELGGRLLTSNQYIGTPEQKIELMKLFQKHNVSQDIMLELASKLKGEDMNNLEKKLLEVLKL